MPQGFDEAWLATLPQRGDSRILEDRGAPPLAPQTPEKTLLGMIRQVATRSGALFYHTHRSAKSEPGFPDIVIAKPGRPLIVAELKSKQGKLTMEQQRWLEFLPQSTGVESYLWRPSDWKFIVEKILEK